MATEAPVYLGIWTNWSRGSAVMGATLTTTRAYGNLLIAFTAFFVPFVASRLWRIFSIIFHQCYATSDPRDAIHHQRQVLLRNSYTPESGLVSFFRLLWAWRRRDRTAWLRVLPMVLFLVCYICAFTVAGGFSSRISTTDEVLLRGDNCEVAAYSGGNATLWHQQTSYWSVYDNNLKDYAQTCYSNPGASLLECSKFITRAVPMAVMDYDAPCPFKAGACVRNNSNIRFDTGHLNSNDIFGLNAPKDETLTYRSVLQCAPLVTEGRKGKLTNRNINFTTYDYGSQSRSTNNYTYAVRDADIQYVYSGPGLANSENFLLTSRVYTPNLGWNGSSSFELDPDIAEPNGEVTILFLSGNGIHFMSRTEDDWYRATVAGGTLNAPEDPEPVYWYRPEEAASPLGCIEQHQWCRDPALGECGDLDDLVSSLQSAAPWFDLTEEDLEAARPVARTKLGSLLLWAFYMKNFSGVTLHWIAQSLGPASLASQRSIQSSFLYGVEKNQWHLDATQWWHILVAGIQSLYVTTAQGLATSPYQPDTILPANEWELELCRNQKIRSAQYSSFSVFGLVFTYAMGVLIVTISFIIEPVLCFLQKDGRYDQYAYLEWEGNTAIQLHRVAQDQLGHGQWSHCDTDVPTTRPGDLLAPFDITDPKHLMLARHVRVASKELRSQSSLQDPPGAETFQYDDSPKPGNEQSFPHTDVGDGQPSSDTWMHPEQDVHFGGKGNSSETGATRRNSLP